MQLILSESRAINGILVSLLRLLWLIYRNKIHQHLQESIEHNYTTVHIHFSEHYTRHVMFKICLRTTLQILSTNFNIGVFIGKATGSKVECHIFLFILDTNSSSQNHENKYWLYRDSPIFIKWNNFPFSSVPRGHATKWGKKKVIIKHINRYEYISLWTQFYKIRDI